MEHRKQRIDINIYIKTKRDLEKNIEKKSIVV